MNKSFIYRCVATLFADMINEANVGNGFRLYNFPKMASQYVVNQLKLSGEYTTLTCQEAELTALEFAKELIDRSGIHD